MSRVLDIAGWNRRQLFEHYMTLLDPFFALTSEVDVTETFALAKETESSFFSRYLHACIRAVNAVENFKYRLYDDKIIIHDHIAASATIARPDHTYGFSFIDYAEDFETFNGNFLKEKERILNSSDLYPPSNTLDCIYCSAIPWVHFTGHKETFAGTNRDSVPRLAFGKVLEKEGRLIMPVAVAANHALIDGYHVGLFLEEFQKNLTISKA